MNKVAKKKILITGGAGFVGSSLALLLKGKYPDYTIVCFDNLKRRGSELNLSRIQEKGVSFVHGDIRNKEDFDSLDNDVSLIIDASAEPSVLAGINGTPDYLINTNFTGTVNCLNFATRTGSGFIFLSTSRVYPIEAIENINFEEEETRFIISENQQLAGVTNKGLSERFPLEGYRSFYGASKLACELLIREYNQYYNVKTIINRCGVLAGPWQMGKVDQGVMGLWVARHFWNKELSYIGYGGKGKQVRDVLHINDLFRLVDHQIDNIEALNGSLFNVGGGTGKSISLQELTKLCQNITGHKINIMQVEENRKADIRIYITDNSHVFNQTGWKPEITVEETVADMFQWIKENEIALKPVLLN